MVIKDILDAIYIFACVMKGPTLCEDIPFYVDTLKVKRGVHDDGGIYRGRVETPREI